jgi:hypothetical protein
MIATRGVARRHVEVVQHRQHAQAAVGAAAGAGERGVLVGEVEARDRLVEQQEGHVARIGVALDQHAGELHALALAARQHGVGAVGEGESLGLAERLFGERAHLGLGQAVAVGEQAQHGDLQAGEVEGHVGMLRQHGASLCELALVPASHGLAVEQHVALRQQPVARQGA